MMVMVEHRIVVYSKEFAVQIIGSNACCTDTKYLYLLSFNNVRNSFAEGSGVKESVCGLNSLYTCCTDIISN